ncbi:MAG: SMI1/KNR4 family protein [Armatimonadota bacterium]
MSMTEYEQAIQLIQQYPQIGPYMWDCSEADIQQVERALGVTFPPIYRRFVRECGALDYYGFDVAGVIPEALDAFGAPDVLSLTQTYRDDADIPIHLIVIEHPGGDYLICLDTRQRRADGEYPVVTYYHWCTEDSQPNEVLAEDFGAYMLERVQWAISEWDQLSDDEKEELLEDWEEEKEENKAR